MQQYANITALVRETCSEHFTELPALGGQAARITALAGRVMDASAAEIEKILRSDPAPLAELLRTANSPLYQRGSPVLSVQDAIVRLGRNEVGSIIVASASRRLFEAAPELYAMYKSRWRALQHHFVFSAFGVAWFATTYQLAAYDIAFLSGMFHDVGKLIALGVIGKLIINGKIAKLPDEVVHFVLQETHGAVGAKSLEQWKMPAVFVDVCAKHETETDKATEFGKLCLAVRLISALSPYTDGGGTSKWAMQQALDTAQVLGFTEEKLRDVVDRLNVIQRRVATLLGEKE